MTPKEKFTINKYINIPYKNNNSGKDCLELVNLIRTDLGLDSITSPFVGNPRKKEVLLYIKTTAKKIKYAPNDLDIAIINNFLSIGLGLFYDNEIITTNHYSNSKLYNYPTKQLQILFFIEI